MEWLERDVTLSKKALTFLLEHSYNRFEIDYNLMPYSLQGFESGKQWKGGRLFYLKNEIDFKKIKVQRSHITLDVLFAQTVFIRF
jgi:hypothetical protein